MLIHAFVASKINNRNFCFLNGLELPAVCYLQLALNKAVHDLTCSPRQKGISLSTALVLNCFLMQQNEAKDCTTTLFAQEGVKRNITVLFSEVRKKVRI